MHVIGHLTGNAQQPRGFWEGGGQTQVQARVPFLHEAQRTCRSSFSRRHVIFEHASSCKRKPTEGAASC